MDAELWEKVREVFKAAVDRPPDDWPRLLDRHCSDDRRLRAEVEALLEGHRRADNFLDGPAIARGPDGSPTGPDFFEGRTIGSYRVVRLLGRGGMGAVYLASRADAEFRKRVAVKVLRPGMGGEEIVRRFRTERQILAALDHPNVARLLDGGTTEDGLPYFVMEYVQGQPIDEYCDGRRLDVRKRLELFSTVCSAVQYAHRNLVVHRDLKPSNVLVMPEGVPKLLDFGIAKLLNPELASPELAPTATALRLMTPEYASPEQVRGEPVTTAADVYSLGVLLYYLLTGHRPYRVDNRSPVEILRVICEQEPGSPSTAILAEEEVPGPDGTTTTVTPESVGRSRNSTPARLSGDLDNIVLMALRKEPERRYGSVEQLAEDVRRHLNGHPVLARKDTFGYRWGKFLRRNRVGVSVVTTFVAACVAFGIAMGVQRAEIARERDLGRRVTDLLVGLFKISDPYKEPGDPIDARDLLREGARGLRDELQGEPLVQSSLMSTIGDLYTNLGLYEEAAPLLEEALEIRERLLDPEDLEVAESLMNLAENHRLQGRLSDAGGLYRRALEIRERALGPDHLEVAASLNGLANSFRQQGDFDRAEELYRRALRIREDALGPADTDVATILNNLANCHREQGRYAEAKQLYRRALAIREATLGPEHPWVADSLINLANVHSLESSFDEAEALHQRALAIREQAFDAGHPEVASSLNSLGATYEAQGRHDDAERVYLRALAIREEALGSEHPDIAQSLNNLAIVHQARRRYDEAEEFFERALAIWEKALGPEHHKVATTVNNLAGLALLQERFDAAEPLIQRALTVWEKRLGPEHPAVATSLTNLAATFIFKAVTRSPSRSSSARWRSGRK